MSKTSTTASADKHQAIRDAGGRVFLRMGYGAASMDLIASEAGVAKQTVYNHFQNKEALFRAIVEELVTQLVAPLTARDASVPCPRQTLKSLGHQFLSLMILPSSLALHRVLVAEANRFPELARDIYAAGPARAVAMLADYLAVQTQRGLLRVGEPERAAEQFFGMLTGHIQLRALFRVGDPPDPQRLDKAVDYAVDGFLKIHAADVSTARSFDAAAPG